MKEQFFAVAAISLSACLALARLAHVYAWLDQPVASGNQSDFSHKTHAEAVPPVGGVAMLVTLLLAAVFWPVKVYAIGPVYWSLLVVLTVVGAVDDLLGLSVRLRFACHVLCVVLMVQVGGVGLFSFGDLFGVGELRSGVWTLPCTIIAVTAMINAFNMLDGLDGLCGGQVALSLLGLMLFAGTAGMASGLCLHLALMLAVVSGFLACNGPLRCRWLPRIFMGDAGSTLWGFVIAWWAIAMSQSGTALPPVFFLWLVALPLWDCGRLMFLRTYLRRPVMGSDQLHVHHVLRRMGCSERLTCVLLWSLGFAMVLLGWLLLRAGMQEVIVLLGYLGCFALYGVVVTWLGLKMGVFSGDR